VKNVDSPLPKPVDKVVFNTGRESLDHSKVQASNLTCHTFPPEKRLLQRQDFTAVFSNAEHRFRQDKLHLIARSQLRGHARLGLVIPKKMLKKAVHRNRLKRVIRDEFRRWHFPKTCDIIISLKQKIDPDELYQQDIHQVIRAMLSRLERYTNRPTQNFKQ